MAQQYTLGGPKECFEKKRQILLYMHQGVLQVYQGVCCCLHCKRQDIIPIPRAENYNCVWFTHGCSWEIAISHTSCKKGKKRPRDAFAKSFLDTTLMSIEHCYNSQEKFFFFLFTSSSSFEFFIWKKQNLIKMESRQFQVDREKNILFTK